jgi:addiction module RelE/StbE family toxin
VRRVIWTRAAQKDVLRQREYIGQFNPLAAQRLAMKLVATGEALSGSANRGRPLKNGMRELTVVWPYIIRYRVEEDAVIILRVRHGARRPL